MVDFGYCIFVWCFWWGGVVGMFVCLVLDFGGGSGVCCGVGVGVVLVGRGDGGVGGDGGGFGCWFWCVV